MSQRIKKFVAIGPESTGKSTLSRMLSEHYHSVWCPEYAREYLEANGTDYTYADLKSIALGQLKLENVHLEKLQSGTHSKVLFVDTDMYVMRVWCEYVFNDCYRFILDEIIDRPYDGYLLCAPDLPWVKDDLREYPDQRTRDELFLLYRSYLIDQPAPWITIDGNYDERLEKAIRFVDGFNV